jgi:hypothetical protein
MRRLAVLLLVCMRVAAAQSSVQPGVQSTAPVASPAAGPAHPQPVPNTPPQLSPQAAYDEAKRPLDITRAPYGNWSEVEQAALAVSIKQASESCKARDPYQFTGEDLIAYARLCSFGEQWQQVQLAAANYILARQAAPSPEKLTGFPSLAAAFDYSVQALLHLSDPISAKGTAENMLRTVSYDDLVSEATGLTARYLQFTGSEDEAIALLEKRQPILLGLFQAQSGTTATVNSSAPLIPQLVQSTRPALSIHALYADAIALPALQQYANQPSAAAASFARIEAALPTALAPDDAILTAATRRQYLLLGAPLPRLAPFAWLLAPTFAVPRDLNTSFGSATALYLFPDWCGCVGMGPQFPPVAERLRKSGVHFYALLAQANPPPPPGKPVATPTARVVPKPAATRAIDTVPPVHVLTAAEYLAGTPTLVVPNSALDAFVATDFPIIVVADHRGIIRVIEAAPENALEVDRLLDEVVRHVLDHWPPAPEQEAAK